MDHKRLVENPYFAAVYPHMNEFEVRFDFATAEEIGSVG
jgi:hypothetical protein